MEPQLTFEWCPISRLTDLQGLIRRLWKSEHIMSHDSELMLWQHRFPGRPDELAVVVVRDGERFIGTLGVMPQPVGICGKILRGAWIVLWVIDPEYRGQNLGARMIQFIYDSGIEIIPFQGANELAARLHAKLGARIFSRLPRWVAALDLATCYQMGVNQEVIDREAVAKAFEGVSELLEAEQAEWDAYFNRELAPTYQGVLRNSEFLNWRYRQHPRYEYRLFKHRTDGALDAILVERVQPAGEGPGGALRIVELLGSPAGMAALANSAVARGQAEGLAFVDFYCSSTDPSEALLTAGFTDRPDSNFPNHFSPFAPGDKSICGGIYRPEHLVDDDFYATRADGDQDRPN